MPSFFSAEIFHHPGDLFLHFPIALAWVGFEIADTRFELLDALPGALTLHHGDGLEHPAVLDALRPQIIPLLHIQRPPYFGRQRELRQATHAHESHLSFSASYP